MNCEAIMNTFKNKTTMSKTKLLYIAIISLLFILQACKRDTDCGDLSDVITNYNIADSNKAKIPYTGTDTLVFVSDANDTAVLIGQGKNTYYQIVTKGLSSGDCPRTSVEKYENVDMNFIGNSAELNKIYFRINTTEFSKNSLIGFEIICNNTYRIGSNLELVYSYLPVEDSILINKKY
ncbi:MAG: hypothetical protein EBZ58_09195, partial [Bacteroidetes bacterium]|nr:hypothetical protein [Bacteroidota bacterium]